MGNPYGGSAIVAPVWQQAPIDEDTVTGAVRMARGVVALADNEQALRARCAELTAAAARDARLIETAQQLLSAVDSGDWGQRQEPQWREQARTWHSRFDDRLRQIIRTGA